MAIRGERRGRHYFYLPPPANGSAVGLRPSFPAAHAIPSQHHPSVGAADGVAPVTNRGHAAVTSAIQTDVTWAGATNLGWRTDAHTCPLLFP